MLISVPEFVELVQRVASARVASQADLAALSLCVEALHATGGFTPEAFGELRRELRARQIALEDFTARYRIAQRLAERQLPPR